jgi:hypothetical protein
MVILEPFPTGQRARWHVATPEPSRIGRWVWSCGTHCDTVALPYRVVSLVARDDVRALPHREADLMPWDMCPLRSPSLSDDVPSAMGHMVMSELFNTESEFAAVGIRGDTGAFFYQVRILTL